MVRKRTGRPLGQQIILLIPPPPPNHSPSPQSPNITVQTNPLAAFGNSLVVT